MYAGTVTELSGFVATGNGKTKAMVFAERKGFVEGGVENRQEALF